MEQTEDTKKEQEETNSLENALVRPSLKLPPKMGTIIVQQRPLFPHMVVPLMVEGKVFLNSLKFALQTTPHYLAVFLAKNNFDSQKIRADRIYNIGVVARIIRIFNQTNDSAQILLDVLSRIEMSEIEIGDEILTSAMLLEEETLAISDEHRVFAREIINNMKELVKMNPLVREELSQFISQINIEDPFRLTDFAATLTSADRNDLQEILEALQLQPRLEKTLFLIKKELDLSRLQNRISKQIEERLSKNQREFFLREQLKEIKKELGLSKDEKSQELEKLIQRAASLKWEKETKAVFQNELEKLRMIDPHSPEYSVTRSYLDWLTCLPWGLYKKETLDLKHASKVLNEDHYGLEDVKNRVLDLIAVMAMRKQVTGKIICLIGPPGVGKTSIGKSIARALNRPFYRFSLGGMRDEAEIKGHRRTYIGAMPGKFIQALKKTKYANPVVMLDEIDKLGRSYQGDPASALLEVLDPEQNNSFLDHYLDVPFDLSKILFICTANQLETIPEPLQDRMEIIRLSGYIAEEKWEIAKRYLTPKQIEATGLKESQISFEHQALKLIIDGYAREAGVRNLEKLINQICRGVARDYLEKKLKFPVKIGLEQVAKYLKRPVYDKQEIFGEGIAGCVNGLAWTPNGGAVLTVEANLMPTGKRGFKQTGQLGKVMVESAEIAYSFVLGQSKALGIDPELFNSNTIHIHVPAGATPKDGPSAGITMAVCLVSILRNEPVVPKIGMTGELGLAGEVLPIGGLREKVVAAKRIGLEKILAPDQNLKDYEELPSFLKEGLEFHFVNHVQQVFDLCFGKKTGASTAAKVVGKSQAKTIQVKAPKAAAKAKRK